MSASSRVPASSSRKQGTARKRQSSRSWLPRIGLRSIFESVSSLRLKMPALVMTDRFRREAGGVALILLALFSAWALGRGATDGPIAEWWGSALHGLFGYAAGLVPVLVALTAIRALRDQEGPVLLLRHYLGAAGYLIAATGMVHLGELGSRRHPGGALGQGVGGLVESALGQFASGILLTAIGLTSVFLLAHLDVRTLEAEVRALWPKRQSASPDGGEDLLLASDPALRPAKVVHPPLQPAEPVVNVPKKESPVTGIVVKPVKSKPGGPLPLPDLSKLMVYDGAEPDKTDLRRKSDVIEATLNSFRVEARVREINPGPTVTQFALEPGLGVPVRRIVSLDKDLALALAAPSIRIEAPVPGMARVGIEIPNKELMIVGLREVLESSVFVKGKTKLPIPLGRDVNGRYVVGDLTKMPHLLIAGQTGAGKSVCLNVIISTFLLTRSPDDLKLLMIDPKMVEMVGYNGVPHLQCPVVTEMDKVVGALKLTVREMLRRYDIFSKLGVRNLEGYKLKTADEPPGAYEHLPYLVVIIDELADLMMTAADEVEGLLVRLAQLARATGIHLIIATQRPTADVITGLIKANVPSRIAFAVASGIDSRVVLDLPGAENLLGRGDMLYLPPEAAKPQRIQCAYIDDKDVQYIVSHWHDVAPLPDYAKEWLELPSSGLTGDSESEDDPMMEEALEIVRKSGTASASMLQRRLRVGYNRAARLIEQMEMDGVIGPADGLKGRTVLIGDD